METRIIKTAPAFNRRYKKLPRDIKEKAKEKEAILRENVFDSRLRTHKLHGEEKDVWAFLINYTYRIKFIFINKETILFLDIGTHTIYK